MEKLFNPQSIAIVGATPTEGKIGKIFVDNLLNLGYEGKVYLVNPKYDELFERKCYPALEEIPEAVDVAIIVVPGKFVHDIIEKNADKIKNYVIISAGFSEVSDDGRALENKIAKLAKEKDLNILGPNCLGFINPEQNLNASFAGDLPKSGNIGFVSQSGALIVAAMNMAKKSHIAFSKVASIGNKMQIDEAKMINYLGEDEQTKVIGLYLEGIKDGKAFIESVEKVSMKKPIVILKAGATERAKKAISSHTGALAGSEKVISAVFEKYGVIQVTNLKDFFNTLRTISSFDMKPGADKNAVVTNAGGAGVLTTDAFGQKKINLMEFKDELKKQMEEALPHEASVENPVDVLGDALEDRYRLVLDSFKDESVGSVICVLTPQASTPVDKIADEVIKFKAETDKPIVTVFIGGDRVEGAISKLEASGVPNFDFPKQAVDTLDYYYQWFQHSQSIKEAAKYEVDQVRKEKADQIIDSVLADGREALVFAEAESLMKEYNIPVIPTFRIKGADEVPEIEYPVVLKVDSDKVLHKTDQKALVLNIQTEEDLVVEIEDMSSRFPGDQMIIQQMVKADIELILGIKRDEIFGPIILFGLGGIYTEIFQTVNFLIPPLTKKEIIRELQESKIKFLFEGFRGEAPYNIDELAEILLDLSHLAQENERIAELDVNPLFVYNDGKGALAVDIKVVIN